MLGPLTDENGQLCPRGPLDYVLMKRLENALGITQAEIDSVMAGMKKDGMVREDDDG